MALFMSSQIAKADILEFAQVSDVHYSISDKSLDKYLFFLSSSIKRQDPDFVIFLGDNVDKSIEDDVISFMRAIHPIRTPYYVALGNSDAHRLSGIEKSEYLDIVSAFNRYQKSNDSYYYFKPNRDFVCVVLDTTSNFAPSKHGSISLEQLVWLESLLQKYPKKLFLIFQHCPVIPPREDYVLSMLDTEKYENILEKYSNIVLVSSGHYHQESIINDKNGVRHISSPAFKDMPHSYQVIKIEYNKDSFYSPKDVEITVTKVKV